MRKTKISIVVCTFNRSDSLRRMLKSLSDIVIPDFLSLETIVVDNNSDDDTRVVFDLVEKSQNLEMRYVFEERRGLSFARNRGVKEASGDIIAFTDDDVVVDQHWIQNIDKAFKEYEGVACVGGRILPIWDIPKPEWLKSDLYGYFALLDRGCSVDYMAASDIWGANFAVRSEMFRKYGPFDTKLGRMPGKLYSGEETEFLNRLQEAGERILYFPLLVVHHHVPEHRMSKKYLRRWRFDQGELEAALAEDAGYSGMVNYNCRTTSIMLFGHVLASLLKIVSFRKTSFDHQLRICHILGFISGRMKPRRGGTE